MKDKKGCSILFKKLESIKDKIDNYKDVIEAILKIDKYKDKIVIPKSNLDKIKKMRNSLLVKIEKSEYSKNVILKDIKS